MRRVLCLSAVLAAACESGPRLVRAAPAQVRDAAAIRVVTFNLYNRPWKRAQRLRTQAAVLRRLDPDVVGLQELATGALLSGEPASRFASELDLGGVRAWHEQNLGLFRTGVGLLSRYPLREVEYREFDRAPFWDAKGFLSAVVDTPRGSFAVISVHVASTDDLRTQQSELDQLAAQVRMLAAQRPVLLLGDFNLQPADAPLSRFIAGLGADSLYAHIADLHPSWNESFEDDCGAPGGQLIDHVLTVPGPRAILRFRGGRIVVPPDTPHPSDHCPVTADLELVPLNAR